MARNKPCFYDPDLSVYWVADGDDGPLRLRQEFVGANEARAAHWLGVTLADLHEAKARTVNA